MTPRLPAFHYIDDAESLRWLSVELSREDLLALDTESNGLYAYKERVCLVQLSTRDQDFIIDPFSIADMSPLGVLLSDPSIEIILHAAEYDLMTLKRDFGFEITRLFDTMIAARLVGYTSFGLAAMLKRFFHVQPDKSHQLDDWGMRPLPPDSLHYAQMDTHYLPGLRDILRAELEAMGRFDEALELFEEAANIPAADNTTDYEGYWKLGRPNAVPLKHMAVLRELYLLREQIAAEEDMPTFKVLTNRMLVNLALVQPANLRALSEAKGMPGAQVRWYGDRILDAIQRGKQAPPPQPPPLPQPPAPDVADRYFVLQQWRKEKGLERGVGSDVVLQKEVLWTLARTLPQTVEELAQVDGIGPQRLRLYGDELAELLANIQV
jgi:ribonuclease D